MEDCGILVCGLNGAGKSTLGRALAERLGFAFLDNEDFYFPKTDPAYPYADPRTREEVEKLLISAINGRKSFVFASVKGDYSEEVRRRFRYAVLVEVPREIRLQRVKNRSLQRFGDRALPGGDLYDSEERFFELVKSRAENTVTDWISELSCPIIRVDGRRAVAENVEVIASRINSVKSPLL